MKQHLITTRAAITLCGLLAAFALTHHAMAGNGGPIDLKTLPGGTWSMAWFVSDAGDVVGMGDNSEHNTRPFVVATKGPRAFQMVDLGTLGGEATDYSAMAMAVNNRGLVVGHVYTEDGLLHAFAWTREGGMVDLDPKSETWSAAFGVNDRGVIVGWSGSHEFLGPDAVAVVWIPDGNGWKITKLAAHPDSSQSAFAINSASPPTLGSARSVGGEDLKPFPFVSAPKLSPFAGEHGDDKPVAVGCEAQAADTGVQPAQTDCGALALLPEVPPLPISKIIGRMAVGPGALFGTEG